jgi:redox-sensing transcriptional repressor
MQVRHMDELEAYLKENPVDVAVLTVPRAVAQATADRLIASGVRGFWNFTNVELSSNESSVQFEDVHFADSLLTLSYRIAESTNF